MAANREVTLLWLRQESSPLYPEPVNQYLRPSGEQAEDNSTAPVWKELELMSGWFCGPRVSWMDLKSHQSHCPLSPEPDHLLNYRAIWTSWGVTSLSLAGSPETNKQKMFKRFPVTWSRWPSLICYVQGSVWEQSIYREAQHTCNSGFLEQREVWSPGGCLHWLHVNFTVVSLRRCLQQGLMGKMVLGMNSTFFLLK